MIVPIVVYWVYSGFYEMFGGLDRHRLHLRGDEETNNLVSNKDVSNKDVVNGVLLSASSSGNNCSTALQGLLVKLCITLLPS